MGKAYQVAYKDRARSRAMPDTKADLTAACGKCADSWTGSEK